MRIWKKWFCWDI